MFDKLNALERRHEELMTLLADPAIQAEPAEYRKHAKALAEMQPLVERFTEYKQVVKDVAQTEELAKGGDADMRELAQEELRALDGAARRAASPRSRCCSSRRIPTTRRTSSSRSGPGPAARKRRCSPASCSACTASSPSGRAGASRCCRRARPAPAA